MTGRERYWARRRKWCSKPRWHGDFLRVRDADGTGGYLCHRSYCRPAYLAKKERHHV